MAINSPKPVQTWCVILQTFAKKNRKELISQLVQGFGLDEQEASDSISNIPIVIVDGINLNQAKSVKEKLEANGAEVEITNHDIIKKQCYRIEWPQQPNLAYFEKKPEAASPLGSVILASESPVNPIVAVAGMIAGAATGPKTPPPAMPAAPLTMPSFPKSVPQPRSAMPVNIVPEKKSEYAPLPKKSWFPFGKKESNPKPVTRPLNEQPLSTSLKSSPIKNDSTYQPKKQAVDLNQSEWKKRTKEIQDRLEKMGAGVSPASSTDAPNKSAASSQPSLPSESVMPPKSPRVEEISQATRPSQETRKESLSSADKGINVHASGSNQKNQENLVDRSQDFLEKIQKLERELIEKKQNLEEKHAELDRTNQDLQQKQKHVDEVQKLGESFSAKVEHLEKALKDKELHLNEKHQELEKQSKLIEEKHQQVETVQKMGETFSEKVVLLEKALSQKEQHLNEKHTELEQRSEREKAFAETISHLEVRIAEKDAELETRRQEMARLAAHEDEALKSKEQEVESVQQRVQEIAQKFQAVEQAAYEKKIEVEQKEAELLSKDQKIKDLQSSLGDLDTKLQEAQSLEKDKEQQVTGLQSREKELLKKIESLEKTLVEMGEALGQRDDSLRQRDDVLVALERRVQDLAEKTGSFETLKNTHALLQEQFEDISGKHNRMSDEYRRFRSKNERKTATLTREMGEWVRKVDHLRQGLQKFNQNILRPDLAEDHDSDSEAPPSAS